MANMWVWFGVFIGLIVGYIILYMGIAWVVAGCRREPDDDDMIKAAFILLVVIAFITSIFIKVKYIDEAIPIEINQGTEKEGDSK